MDIEQCIGRSKQIPRTQHEQGYIDAICWLLQELEKRPVVVEQNADATDMNELHGDAYGVDWVYPAPSAPEDFNDGFNSAADYFKPAMTKASVLEPNQHMVEKGMMALLECSHSDLSSYSSDLLAGYEEDVRRVLAAARSEE